MPDSLDPGTLSSAATVETMCDDCSKVHRGPCPYEEDR